MYSILSFELVHCSISGSNCCSFTSIEISQKAGKMVRYSHLFKNSTVCCDPHSQRLYSVVNEAEADVFQNSLAFFMIQRMLAIWSWVPLPFLYPACTSGSSWFMSCWSLAWRFWALPPWRMKWVQLYGSLNILWHCCSLGLEWKLTFCSRVTTAEFSKFASYWVQHFNSIILSCTKLLSLCQAFFPKILVNTVPIL